MERFEPLNSDPLRFEGACLPGRALRRLEAAGARIGPLAAAGRGLASLTLPRLVELISPPTGADALAAALASSEQVATAGVDAQPHTRRAPRIVAARPEDAKPASHRRERTAVRGRRPAPAATPPAGLAAAVSTQLEEARRETTERRPARAAPGAPLAPTGFEDVGEVQGLDWLAARVAGGAEAAETPLVDGLPEVESPWPAAPRETAFPPAIVPPAAEGLGPTSRTASTFARALEPRQPTQPVAAQPVAAPPDRIALPAGGGDAGELEALVRGWHAAHGQPAIRTELPRPSGASGDSVPARTMRAERPLVRDRREAHARESEEELVAFGDALGRVLVAELRRYGIEVDEG